MQKGSKKEKERPKQHQKEQPGKEHKMIPQPVFIDPKYKGSNKLLDKVAIITGGDSGIGRAVACHFAMEGAHVAVVYLNEDKDAKETKAYIEEHSQRKCLLIKTDVSEPRNCKKSIEQTLKKFNRLDIVVNNAAQQFEAGDIREISKTQLEKTFRINIFSMFYMVQAALPHLKEGSSIINTTSVTAYRGSSHLLDYSSTKGAIVSFTRSLSANLAEKKIRVNGVAPGPIWTPLIPASFPADHVATFGSEVPLGRAGEPAEVGPCYVFLASDDASYMTGQILHPNGGEIVNG